MIRGGGGEWSAEIADIGKGKISPLINTDDTDRKNANSLRSGGDTEKRQGRKAGTPGGGKPIFSRVDGLGIEALARSVERCYPLKCMILLGTEE
jgi:hypothetical protein